MAGGVVKLMVVDDEVLIRAGLAALLRATPGFEVVAEAADGEQAVALAAATGPEVILMDIRMPGVDGIHATERILAASPVPPRVMVLTTFDLDEYVYAALRAGAAGFLLKQTEPRQLISAIEVVAAGETLFAPSVTRRLIEAYLAHSGESPRPQAVPPGLRHLTTREREVLRHVATGKSNTEIAAALTVSEATVKTHLNRTMTKLALTSRAQAVVLAYETGLVIPRACLDADVPTA